MGSYAGWNGYQYWQAQQSGKASALFDELEKSVASGDMVKLERAWADMKERFPSTTFAAQSALLVAKSFQMTDKPDAAKAALQWASETASDQGSAQLARLRLANLQAQQKAFDEALKTLSKPFDPHLPDWPPTFKAIFLRRKTNRKMPSKLTPMHGASWKKILNTVVWLQPN